MNEKIKKSPILIESLNYRENQSMFFVSMDLFNFSNKSIVSILGYIIGLDINKKEILREEFEFSYIKIEPKKSFKSKELCFLKGNVVGVFLEFKEVLFEDFTFYTFKNFEKHRISKEEPVIYNVETINKKENFLNSEPKKEIDLKKVKTDTKSLDSIIKKIEKREKEKFSYKNPLGKGETKNLDDIIKFIENKDKESKKIEYLNKNKEIVDTIKEEDYELSEYEEEQVRLELLQRYKNQIMDTRIIRVLMALFIIGASYILSFSYRGNLRREGFDINAFLFELKNIQVSSYMDYLEFLKGYESFTILCILGLISFITLISLFGLRNKSVLKFVFYGKKRWEFYTFPRVLFFCFLLYSFCFLNKPRDLLLFSFVVGIYYLSIYGFNKFIYFIRKRKYYKVNYGSFSEKKRTVN